MLVLCALPFRHIDVSTENLDKLSARGEPMMGGYVEIFDCSIRQYDSELARVVSFLAYCLLNPFPYLASIVWVDPLPHSIAARKALQRIKPPDAVVFLRIIDSRQCPIGDPGASVAEPLCFRQIGLAAAQSFRALAERLFRSLALGDVAPDLRGADDCTFSVRRGRNRQRNIDQAAVLMPAHGLVVVDGFTAADARENSRLLVEPIRRNQDGDRPADALRGFVSEQALGPAIPGPDDSVEILADDGVVGGFDDRGELLGRLLRALALRQIKHESDTLIPAFLEGRRADHHRNTAAVFPEVLLLKRLQAPSHLQLGQMASFIAVTPFGWRQLRPA